MKDKPQDAEIVHEHAVARIDSDKPVLSVAGMMQAVIDKGISAENVGVMEKLVGLFERMEAKKSEQLFNEAFVSLQKEMPRIQAKQAVPNNDGTTRYVFAPYESIMEQVQPFLVKHGFTVSFSTRFDGPRIVKICTLRHSAGHSVSNEFAARIGAGPPKASEAQADGAAGTYAKRFALCDALNIVVEADSDARAEGGPVSNSLAVALRKRVLQTGSDEKAFLRYAKSPVSDNATEAEIVAAYQNIPSGMYDALDQNLQRKEKVK